MLLVNWHENYEVHILLLNLVDLVLLVPSSVEIFNFSTRRTRSLKFWQNDVLMSTLFCENFSPFALYIQKLKFSTLDGAKST